MNYADEIRRQVEAAPRAALPAVTAALWKAFGEGQVTEAEAESLSNLIDARRSSETGQKSGQGPNPTATAVGSLTLSPSDRAGSPRRAVGSRPRTDASMERRRRWAASGRLPPAIAARFTLAEQAVLALVAAEIARRKDCRLSIENMAAVAGVCRSTVKNAIREARQLGLLTVEERQITGFRNDTNVVRIVSPEWSAWLRLGRKQPRHDHHGRTFTLPLSAGGVKSSTSTPTGVLKQRGKRPSAASDGLPEGSGRPEPKRFSWNRRGR